MKNQFIIICGFLLFNSIILIAQSSHFINLHREDGLTSNKITTIYQDSYGFMWFGTKKGLNRYDGIKIDSYYPIENDSSGLGGYYVNDIFQSSSGKLVVSNERGIDVFDYKRESFKRVRSNEEGAKIILEDESNNVIIGVPNGRVLKFNKDLIFTGFVDVNRLVKESFKIDSNIENFFEFDANTFVFHIKELGLCTFNINSNKVSLLAVDNLSGVDIYKVFPIDLNEIWVTTSMGVYIYRNGVFGQYYTNQDLFGDLRTNKISDLQIMNEKEIWIFTELGGVYVYNNELEKISYTIQNINEKNSVASNSISTTFIDKSLTLWIGTVNNGISQMVSNNPFKTYKLVKKEDDKETNLHVSSLFFDNNNRLWIGSDGNGLYTLDKTGIRHVSVDPNILRVRSINQCSLGRLLLGTIGKGVTSFDIGSKKVMPQPNINKLFGNSDVVHTLLKDTNNHIWVGANKSLKINDPTNKKCFSSFYLIEGIEKPALSMYQKSKDSILYGSWKGLYSYSNGKSKLISDEPFMIFSIVKYSDNKYWLATAKGICLIDLKDGNTIFYGVNEGLNDVNVKSLIADNSNNLWLGTPEGISKFDINNKRFTNYTYKDGFVDNSFARTVVAKSNKGKLYFGGYNGLLEFHPDSVQLDTEIKEVVFNEVLINHQKISKYKNQVSEKYIADASEIILKNHQKIVTINYSSFNFGYANKVNYSYKLEGFDEQWKFTSDPSVTFMNLYPGDYILKVKASSTSGLWGNNYKSLKIKVLPHWWQTGWFYVVLVLILVVIAYAIHKIVLGRHELKRKYDFEKKSFQKQIELDEKQLNFFTNISHEILTPLTLILSPIEELLNKDNLGENIKLKLIQKNALRIKKLLNRGIDYRKAKFKESKMQAENIDLVNFLDTMIDDFNGISTVNNISLSFDRKSEECFVWVDVYMMETVFYNLFSNAIKYSHPGGKIIIKLKEVENKVIVVVQDFGRGIVEGDLKTIFERFYQGKEHVEGNGIGLELVRRFVEAHQGTINVESEYGKGSSFIVRLLKGDKHIEENLKLIKKEVKNNYHEEIESENSNKKLIDNSFKVCKSKKVVLIVEDNEDLLIYLKNNLSQVYKILTANNGVKALEMVNKFKVDIVISDVMMPEMNGIELCKSLKSNSDLSSIPLILLTAKIMSHDKVEGYHAGADAYIEKPFQLDVLKARVKNLIENRELRENVLLDYLSVGQKLEGLNDSDEEFYNKVISILEENIGNQKFDIPFFVNEIGMSKSVIYKKMNKITDVSINDLLVKIRLKKASKLLIYSNKTVLEIAVIVGFQNAPYFSTCFKKEYGKTPSDFRKENLKPTEKIYMN